MPPLNDVFPVGYLRLDEVTVALGVSDATVERMTRDGRLPSKLVPRSGRKGERMYLSEAVERLKEEKEKRVALRPPSAQTNGQLQNGEGKAEIVSVKTFPLQAVRELLLEWSGKREEVGLREKFWLTWDEGAALSGIPVAYVRQAARDGQIVARRFGRSWRVLRKSLEQFEG
jgi:excisionase family DNA binding protein